MVLLSRAMSLEGATAVPSQPGRNHADRWRDLAWAVGVVLVLAAILDPLLRGQLAPKWDAADQFIAYYSLVADHARAGRLATWNPWTDGGMPLFIEPQSGALSPLTVLCGLLFGAGEAGYRHYWCVLWTLAALGMFLLARHLGAPRAAAAALSLGFALSGPFCGNAEHTAWVYASVLLPWIIWRWDVTLTTGRTAAALQAGALFGLCALGGYPGFVVATAAFCLLWLGCRWLDGTLRFAPRAWLLAAALGLLVGSPLYASFAFDGKGFTDRTGVLDRASVIGNNPLAPGALWTLLSPSFSIAKLTHRGLWPHTDISSVSLFCGLIPLALALFAVVSPERRRWRLGLAGLGLASFVTACSETFPLRGWLYDLLPPFRYFQQSSLFRLFMIFSLCALGAESARALTGRADLRKRVLPLSLAFALLVPLGYCYFQRRILGAELDPVALGQCCAVPLLLLGATALPSSRPGIGRSLALGLFVAALLLDGHWSFRLSRPTIGDDAGWVLNKWRDLDRAHVESLALHGFARAVGRSKNNDNLLVKQPELHNYSALRNGLHIDLRMLPMAESMVTGAQRVWFAPTAPELPVSNQTLHDLGAELARRYAAGFVIHSRRAMLTPAVAAPQPSLVTSSLPIATAAVVRLQRYDATHLVFDWEAPANGWLFIGDRWARGWEARVNGRPTELLGANLVFRAVAVPAGRIHVEMTYRPKFLWLVALSWPGCLLGLLSGLWPLLVRRRAPARPARS